MKKILSRFPKEDIVGLDRASFEGRIIIINSTSDADKAVDYLMSRQIVGMDTETRPNFTRGKMNPVSLLQVSTEDTCFLFRLNQIGITDSIIRLLTEDKLLRVALSWHDDVTQLCRRRAFKMGKFIELQTMAAELGIKDMSLQKLYANIFGKKISKSQRLSNWDTDALSQSQKIYASTDAWACVRLYEEMQKMKCEGYELVIVPEPEHKEQDKT